MNKLVSRYVVPAAAFALAPVAAFAEPASSGSGSESGQGLDFSTLTAAVSAATVIKAVMAVAAVAATVYLAVAGAKLILAQIRRV